MNGHFFDRIGLENMFILWRYISIFEGRYTYWKLPDDYASKTEDEKEEIKEKVKERHPFSLHREIWSSILSYYYEMNSGTFQAERFIKLLTPHATELFFCAPCRALTDLDCYKRIICNNTKYKDKHCDPSINISLLLAFSDCLFMEDLCHSGSDKTILLLKPLLAAIKNKFGDGQAFWFCCFFVDFLILRMGNEGLSEAEIRCCLKKILNIELNIDNVEIYADKSPLLNEYARKSYQSLLAALGLYCLDLENNIQNIKRNLECNIISLFS